MEKSSYDDVGSYDDDYYYDYSEYPDNILPYYDDERISWNNRFCSGLFEILVNIIETLKLSVPINLKAVFTHNAR